MGSLGVKRYGPFGQQRLSDLLLSCEQSSASIGREALLGPNPYPLNPLLGPLSINLLQPSTPPRSNIHKAFQTCLSNIELDATRSEQAKQHYNAIKNWLEARLSGVEVRRVGSFQRHTKIRPAIVNGVASPIDIDALVCFGDARSMVSYGGATGSSCLQMVIDALSQNRVYKLLKPTIDHPVVSLSYANEFYIELVPCYRNRLLLEDWQRHPASYLVCNSSGNWEPADYDYDSHYISQANKDTDGKLIPAIKLIKQFCRNNRLKLKSFQIELLCVRLLTPFISVMKDKGLVWEWQDLLVFFLLTAPSIFSHDLSLPGSKSRIPPIENQYFLGIRMQEWGELFAKLSKNPLDSKETVKIFKLAYGERFPST